MLDVLVNAGDLEGSSPSLVRTAVRHTLRAASVDEAEVSITLLSDIDIQALNREYLGRDHPTDVIAFSLDESSTFGDVYIGLDRARDQASDHGVPLEEELVRLAVHGTLHVLGHDHPEGSERLESPMFELQERLVREVFDAS